MSERKVLNKYYPPDFDPSKIPRRSGPKNSQQVVRLMAPFSMRCNTCGEYIYKGKKFNARKETVEGEDYYGIKIFRFYIKCTLCSAEITFKTDPKNTDYAAEHGASRNFEPWREVEIVEEEDRLAKLEEEENNPMKVLENRTTDSKREMEILDALQDIRARNARHERVAVGSAAEVALDARIEPAVDEEELKRIQEEEEDDAIVWQYFSKVAGPVPSSSRSNTESGAGSSSSTVAAHNSAGDSREEEDDPVVRQYSSEVTSIPISGPSNADPRSSTDDNSGGDTPADPASLQPQPPHMVTVKRKADLLEPDLDAMMAQAAKAAMPTIAQPSKKKKADMASKLGIKVKSKVKA